MIHYYTINSGKLAMLVAFFNLFSFWSAAQLGGTITTDNQLICMGQNAPIITFTATNGTAPYSFTYSFAGSMPITISSATATASIQSAANTPGVYTYQLITVEDANSSATVNQALDIIVNANPNVNAGPDITVCQGQSIMLTATGAMAYTWNNGAASNQNFVPLVTATYTVTGQMNGCIGTDQITVTVIPFTPPTVTASIDSALCHDGTIALTMNGGAPPYEITWQNGNTSAMINSLDAGTYSASVSDGNGCTTNVAYTVPASLLPAECGIITGSVHYDQNQDCVLDPADAPIANRIIVANPGNYITYTDQNGNYTLNLQPGNYTVEEVFSAGFGDLCTASYPVTIAAAQTVSNIDFMDTIIGGGDCQIDQVFTNIVFGNSWTMINTITDLGGNNGLGLIHAWFTIPAGTTMGTWAYPHTISNDTVYYEINTLSTNFTAYLNFTNGSLTMGSYITSCAGFTASIPDSNLTNNLDCSSGIIVGPYDPNDITMFLNGTASDSTILETDVSLDYVIRFQNTGTAEAVNVYVLDTISTHLDLSSLQLVSSSHPCQLSLLNDRTMKFDFPQIHLADSNTNEPASHGFIHYKIRQNPANTVGTIINNTAYIYFDFNEAVITNTTYDIIITDLGTDEKSIAPKLEVYPNPSDSKVNLKSESMIQSVKLYSLNGQIMRSENPQANDLTLDLSGLSQGVYLLAVETAQGIVTKKIQKM